MKYLLVLLFLLTACGSNDAAPVHDPATSIPDEWEPLTAAPAEILREAVVVAPAPTQVRSGPRTFQVVYVNFDGPTITDCNCSDAQTDRSLVIGRIFGADSVDFAPYTNATSRTAILDKLRGFFADYAVEFTTTRPTGDYTMLVISPTSGPHHGVAPQDCGNANPNDIAFVYKIGNSSADTIARFAAHELGHSFGLAHVLESSDIMQWASSGRAFQRSTIDRREEHWFGSCVEGDVQDEPAILHANLGTASWSGTFSDDDRSIFEDSIEKIAAEGITNGCGQDPPRFCPEDTVTRGQMAAFLNRALDLTPATQDYFTDDDDSIFEDDINRLAQAQITMGCGVDRFCPDGNVTRGQMAAFLTRALRLPAASNDHFDDDDGRFYEDAANRMFDAQITNGCGTRTYCGEDPVTRGQMAAFLSRALGL